MCSVSTLEGTPGHLLLLDFPPTLGYAHPSEGQPGLAMFSCLPGLAMFSCLPLTRGKQWLEAGTQCGMPSQRFCSPWK